MCHCYSDTVFDLHTRVYEVAPERKYTFKKTLQRKVGQMSEKVNKLQCGPYGPVQANVMVTGNEVSS